MHKKFELGFANNTILAQNFRHIDKMFITFEDIYVYIYIYKPSEE